MVQIGYWYGDISDISYKKSLAPREQGIPLGKMVTPFMLEGLDGSPVTVGKAGKIIVINFWNTWYLPCQDEMVILEKFYQNNQGKILFYGINIQESSGEINDFMKENNYQIPILLDKDGDLSSKFQVDSIPTTIIINKYGMIKYRKSGIMTKNELEGITNSL